MHGTRARYVQGPAADGTPGGCRCPPCTRANVTYETRRNRMIAYGRWEPYTDAAPARDHLLALREQGIGWRQAAALSGVHKSSVQGILGMGGRTIRRVRPETAAAILAVQPVTANIAPHGLVDAAGTRRRLQALVCCGWSVPKLAGQLGLTRCPVDGYLTRGQVTAATARAVAALYDRLWDTPPPETTHRDRIAASRARNMARARRWAPPCAWDDDEIDDPRARARGRRPGSAAVPPGDTAPAPQAREGAA